MPVRCGHVQRGVPVVVARVCERGGAEAIEVGADVVEVAVPAGEQEFFLVVGSWCLEGHGGRIGCLAKVRTIRLIQRKTGRDHLEI